MIKSWNASGVTWTMAIPVVNKTSEIHWLRESERRSIVTEKNAVVRILSWYVTWNVAASRFDTAVYCSEFWIVYRHAGMASFHESPEKTSV